MSSLREVAFPLWRFQMLENEVIYYLTLAMKNLGILECLVIMGIARTKIDR